MIKRLSRLALFFLAGIFAAIVLLVAVYALPIDPMAAHVRASIPALNGEWGEEGSYHQLVKGYTTTQLDNSTDAAMLLAAVTRSDKPLFQRAMEASRYIDSVNALEALFTYGEQGDAVESRPVSRYWHGYLVFLKPLLCVMSYLDIRMLLMLVQSAMLAAVIAGLCRRKLEKLIPAFLLSLLCITPHVTGFSLQFSTSFLILLSAMIVLLYLPARRFAGDGLYVFFLLCGMATSYIDYLTYPLVTFGIPFALVLFLFPGQDAKSELLRFIGCGLCWAVGYFGLWASKWLIASFVTDEQWYWANLMYKINERSSSVSGELDITYGMVLRQVLGIFCKRAYLAAFLAAGAAWIWRFLKTRRMPVSAYVPMRSILLFLTGLLPFAWYFATKNHSYNHAFFTSRTLAVSAFAFGCLLISFLREKGQEKN